MEPPPHAATPTPTQRSKKLQVCAETRHLANLLRSPVLHPGPAQLVSVLPVLYSERAVHLTLRPGPVLASKPANCLTVAGPSPRTGALPSISPVLLLPMKQYQVVAKTCTLGWLPAYPVGGKQGLRNHFAEHPARPPTRGEMLTITFFLLGIGGVVAGCLYHESRRHAAACEQEEIDSKH